MFDVWLKCTPFLNPKRPSAKKTDAVSLFKEIGDMGPSPKSQQKLQNREKWWTGQRNRVFDVWLKWKLMDSRGRGEEQVAVYSENGERVTLAIDA